MPYLIFVFGLLIGLYAFYRFFVSAKPEDIRLFLRNALIGLYILILLAVAMSGRIIIAIILLLLCVPFIVLHFKKKKNENAGDRDKDSE